MKIVVIGANGLLGADIVSACKKAGWRVTGLDLPAVDIVKYDSVSGAVPAADWVVNCAGFTNVDGAEEHRDKAYAVNSEGARNVARACVKKNTRLLHISTDYVFDGHRRRPYKENDQPNPLSVYGASKLAGEKGVRGEGGDFLILRTQSLFGKQGHNFVKAIVRRAVEERADAIEVVEDQVSAPTYSVHLAGAIVRLLPLNKVGLVHVAATGECSWFEFAEAIVNRVRPEVTVKPVTAAHIGRRAIRPAYAVLDSRQYRLWTGHTLPSWQEGLDDYLREEGY